MGQLRVRTDELGCETVFGFCRYAETVKDIHGRTLAKTGLVGWWHFSNFVDSPDPRVREIVRVFAEGGFVEREKDEFGAVVSIPNSSAFEILQHNCLAGDPKSGKCELGAHRSFVGLNVATRHRRELEQPTHAVLLSGNESLVAVLREALTRDAVNSKFAHWHRMLRFDPNG